MSESEMFRNGSGKWLCVAFLCMHVGCYRTPFDTPPKEMNYHKRVQRNDGSLPLIPELPPAGAFAEAPWTPPQEPLFSLFDADHNEELSLEEMDQAMSLFLEVDQNEDGAVTRREIAEWFRRKSLVRYREQAAEFAAQQRKLTETFERSPERKDHKHLQPLTPPEESEE